MFWENWKKILMVMLVGLVVMLCLVILTRLITRTLAFFKKKENEQKKEMSRGGILITSIFIEVITLAILCVPPWFLPITTIWKISITSAGLVAVLVIDFLLVYFWWAPNNLFWTFVPEGRAKIVVRGDAFKKVLIQWQGHKLIKRAAPDGSVDEGDVIDSPTKKSLFGGLMLYGCWPLDDVFVYNFSWTNLTESGEPKTHTKETLDYILLKDDVYLVEVKEAEDKAMLPLDIQIILTIRILNPYKALFQIQSWLEAVKNRIEPAIRDCVTKNTFENWIAEPKDLGQRIFANLKKKNGIVAELRTRYGADLRALGVRDINPNGDFRGITVKKVTAEKERERILVEADAEKQRIEMVYRQVQQFGKVGELIRVLEALEKAPGEGSKLILPLPGMSDLISQVFPNRKGDSFDPEEIKLIRELVQGLQQKKEAT
ncbi:MAG: hypothetical protein A2V72_02935 [Candidatus Nealsonbacteria bacterium RBG_13_37_56]|uniref:Band 7 domain-containing protein n=1 Tax=Candidatus Nealsonbacteria bacterium RBG_13_37_56 TaxID=1801661 RepID=A0A1G2DWI7_9BACT|nr:MAG: hypothetical protein A2V72_02935 [Candidatus Nealsonbacteria bacterium RBG_13_37_56]